MKYTGITICKSMLCGAVLIAALATVSGDVHAALGVDFDPPTSNYLAPGTNGIAGWSFTANRDLYVTALGIYDHEADRKFEGSHIISLWKSDGSLLASVSFTEPTYPHSEELVNGKYHMINVGATLQAGQTYVVAATMGTSDAFAFFDGASAASHNLQFNSNLTYGRAVYSDTLTGMPDFDTQSEFGNFGANIDVTPTPIPAAAWLLGSGLLGLVGVGRRKSEAGFQRKVHARQPIHRSSCHEG
jgi:hypothetical protein